MSVMGGRLLKSGGGGITKGERSLWLPIPGIRSLGIANGAAGSPSRGRLLMSGTGTSGVFN